MTEIENPDTVPTGEEFKKQQLKRLDKLLSIIASMLAEERFKELDQDMSDLPGNP